MKAAYSWVLLGAAVAKLTCYAVIVYLLTKIGYTPLYWEFWTIMLLIPVIDFLTGLIDEFKKK